jgi:hypothetical protein
VLKAFDLLSLLLNDLQCLRQLSAFASFEALTAASGGFETWLMLW